MRVCSPLRLEQECSSQIAMWNPTKRMTNLISSCHERGENGNISETAVKERKKRGGTQEPGEKLPGGRRAGEWLEKKRGAKKRKKREKRGKRQEKKQEANGKRKRQETEARDKGGERKRRRE